MIFEKIKAIIVDKLSVDPEEVAMETTFDDLGADSLDIVEIVMAIEEEFDVEIADDEAEQAKSVGDVVTYIQTATGEE